LNEVFTMRNERRGLSDRTRFLSILIVMIGATACAGVTHVGVAVDDHVRLLSLTPMPLQDIRFSRALRDGSTQQPWFVPAGRILVLTDFEYTALNDAPGRSVRCSLYAEHGAFNPILIPLIVLGGAAGTRPSANPIVAHTSLTSGIVVDSGDAIVANGVECGEDARMKLIGYLVDAPSS
jgi:hypothetical protein